MNDLSRPILFIFTVMQLAILALLIMGKTKAEFENLDPETVNDCQILDINSEHYDMRCYYE